MKYGQLVVGPAGCGKSTYCSNVAKHCESIGRRCTVVNLDPAAESFEYQPAVDVRELISLADVMEDADLKLGPNGGLIYCMEYLVSPENLEWIDDQFAQFEDDYVLFDCPGQIELYTHMDVMKTLIKHLARLDFRLIVVFLLDSQFACDSSKFFSGVLVSLSTIINLDLPAINILTKIDLLNKDERKRVKQFYEPASDLITDDDTVHLTHNQKFKDLTMAISTLIDDYSLVKFFPLNISKQDSLNDILMVIDDALQVQEDADVKIRDFDEEDPEDMDQ